MSRKPKIDDTTTIESLQDYETIRKRLPNLDQKYVKRLKGLMAEARSIGYPGLAHWFVTSLVEIHPQLQGQMIGNYRWVMTRRRNEKTKPTPHEESGQLELFHPEAFAGGNNQTLKEM